MVKLYGILARERESAVIFRRGPSKHVRLIGWNLKTNTFSPGQWFKGRIYERKSDLSPNGGKLVYYAAKYSGPFATWIAVSTPPFLTAHVLWRANGTWNDLSIFETNNELLLATYSSDATLRPEPGFDLPLQLNVRHKPWPGFFHKLPDHDRLIRDGWSILDGDPVYRGLEGEPVTYHRSIGQGRAASRLSMSATAGARAHYAILRADGEKVALQADWAETRRATVYFSQGGLLFEMVFNEAGRSRPPKLLADFSEMTFEAIEAPPRARRWQTNVQRVVSSGRYSKCMVS